MAKTVVNCKFAKMTADFWVNVLKNGDEKRKTYTKNMATNIFLFTSLCIK